METTTLCRLAFIYSHLILCVFALHTVLYTDLQVLRGRMDAMLLQGTHQRLVWLLVGLWASGAAVALIDLGFDVTLLGERPKLVAKLLTVGVLTLNGLLLTHWCFPRLAAGRRLRTVEHSVLLGIGAVSTTSWMMAAFFGIARPLEKWSILGVISLYGCALGVGLAAALIVGAFLRSSETTSQGAVPASSRS